MRRRVVLARGLRRFRPAHGWGSVRGRRWRLRWRRSGPGTDPRLDRSGFGDRGRGSISKLWGGRCRSATRVLGLGGAGDRVVAVGGIGSGLVSAGMYEAQYGFGPAGGEKVGEGSTV